MKVRSALKQMCKKCKIIKRGKKQLVICPENPRHKQRQNFSTLATGLASSFEASAALLATRGAAVSLSPLSSLYISASMMR